MHVRATGLLALFVCLGLVAAPLALFGGEAAAGTGADPSTEALHSTPSGIASHLVLFDSDEDEEDEDEDDESEEGEADEDESEDEDDDREDDEEEIEDEDDDDEEWREENEEDEDDRGEEGEEDADEDDDRDDQKQERSQWREGREDASEIPPGLAPPEPPIAVPSTPEPSEQVTRPTATATRTRTPTRTATATPTQTATETPVATPTVTPTATPTPTPTPTVTPTPSSTPSPPSEPRRSSAPAAAETRRDGSDDNGGAISRIAEDSFDVSRTHRSGRTTTRVSDAPAGKTVTVARNMRGPGEDASMVTVDTVRVTLATPSKAFRTQVARPSPASGAARLPSVARDNSLAVLNMSTTLSPYAIANARLTFHLHDAELPGEWDADNVRLYQYDRGRWRPLDHTYDASTGRYRALTDDLSQIVIVSRPPGRVEVTDVSGLADWVRDGHTTSLDATVVNPGEQTITKALTVTIDGVAVAERNVTLHPSEQRSVRMQFEASAGTVAVEGVTVGQLRVSEQYGDRRGELPPERDDGRQSTDPVGTVLALLALSGAGVVLWRYRQ